MTHGKWLDFNTVRGGAALDERGIAERSDQRGLADIAFADQQDLRFVLRNGVFQAAKVGGESVCASFDQLGNGSFSGLPRRSSFSPLVRRSASCRGSAVSCCRRAPALKVGELADLRRQRGQLIAVEAQRLEG